MNAAAQLLRASARAHRSTRCAASSRSLVSSVLLTRSYDSETVAQLKQEAKRRGLSQSGTKPALVARLQDADKRASHPSVPPSDTRSASIKPLPAMPAGAPPPMPEPLLPHAQTLDLKMPDLLPPEPIQIQIPFVPDLWHSSRVIEEAEKSSEPAIQPKLNVVDGSDNHPAEGVAHNVYHSTPATTTADSGPASRSETTIWADLLEDLGLPRSFNRSIIAAEQTIVDALPDVDLSGGMKTGSARKLTSDERRGVWVIVGALASSWLLAGVFSPSS